MCCHVVRVLLEDSKIEPGKYNVVAEVVYSFQLASTIIFRIYTRMKYFVYYYQPKEVVDSQRLALAVLLLCVFSSHLYFGRRSIWPVYTPFRARLKLSILSPPQSTDLYIEFSESPVTAPNFLGLTSYFPYIFENLRLDLLKRDNFL